MSSEPVVIDGSEVRVELWGHESGSAVTFLGVIAETDAEHDALLEWMLEIAMREIEICGGDVRRGVENRYLSGWRVTMPGIAGPVARIRVTPNLSKEKT